MRLVVGVDRDDDLGRKAGIAGPVVGRQAVLDAALKLGTADPEDSDTNAMFAAVNLADELKQAGESVEVVILTGDGHVGTVSDRRVASQLDQVLSQIPVEAFHLVSDGEEDEYLYPLLASRRHVDSIRKVYVRQSASLQGTYYTLVRALKDQKLRTKTLLPLAGLFIFLSLIWYFQVWNYGIIALSFLVGVYLLVWTFEVDEWFVAQAESFGKDLRQGSLTVFFGVLTFALVLFGILLGSQAYAADNPANPVGSHMVALLSVALLWWVAAALVWEAGRALRFVLFRGRLPRTVWVAVLSLTAFGVEAYSLTYLAGALLGWVDSSFLVVSLVGVVLGVATGGLAGTLRQYLRRPGEVPASGEGTPTATSVPGP
jgi:putative membrane protein